MNCDYCGKKFSDNKVYVICMINAKEMYFCEEKCKNHYEKEHDYVEIDIE